MKTKPNLIQNCLLGAMLLWAASGGAQPTVTQIAAGAYHSLFIESDGSLWVMGYNSYGQLGDGTIQQANRPEQIVSSGVTAIAGGPGVDHSLFIKSDGSLWGMGSDGDGQLGDGLYDSNNMATFGTNLPEMIVPSGVTAIAAGGSHSLFIKKHGNPTHLTTELWAMGDNYFGELGDGTTNMRTTPVMILSYTAPAIGSPVTAIAAGFDHSLFLEGNGSLWAMGFNADGELGDGTTNNRNLPVEIEPAGVTAIAAGGYHSMFAMNDGSLWVMGRDEVGQLGDGSTNKGFNPTATPEMIEQGSSITSVSITAMAGGAYHSLFLNSSGSLQGTGLNVNGQLGDGTHTRFIYATESLVPGGVTAIAAGWQHSLYLTSDGSLWGMGDNSSGQLGSVVYTTNTLVPQLIVTAPPPPLGVTTVGNLPVVVFAPPGTNYELQMSTNLASGNWVTVTNGVPLIGLQITNAPGAAFFRLH